MKPCLTLAESSLAELETKIRTYSGRVPYIEIRFDLLEHPELLGDEASALLDSWIDRARQEGEAQMEEVFTLARLVLHRCRAVGVESAFVEFMEAAPVTTAAGGRSGRWKRWLLHSAAEHAHRDRRRWAVGD